MVPVSLQAELDNEYFQGNQNCSENSLVSEGQMQKEKHQKNIKKLAKQAFGHFLRGCSFSTLLVISPSLFSGLTFPLFHGSSFPSLFFIPFFPLFHDPSFPSLLLSLSSLSSMVLPFPLYCSSLSSLSSMVLPFPLYSSSLSSMISSPCRPGLAPGT